MFSTDLLVKEPWRYAIIAEAVLPAVMLGVGAVFFAPTKSAAIGVNGRPPGWAFGVIWSVLIIIWTIALILSAMNMRKNLALFGLGIFALLGLVMCFTWMVLYKKMMKTTAYFVILASVAFMLAATLCSATSETNTSQNAKTVTTVSLGLVCLWLLLASNLSLTELNLKQD